MILGANHLKGKKGQGEQLVKYKESLGVTLKDAINLMGQRALFTNMLNSSIPKFMQKLRKKEYLILCLIQVLPTLIEIVVSEIEFITKL